MRTREGVKHVQRRNSFWEVTRRWVKRRSEPYWADMFQDDTGEGNHSSLSDHGLGSSSTSSQVASCMLAPAPDNPMANSPMHDPVDTQELRLFVGTWNVAGKSPKSDWDIEEWLKQDESEAPADIYVLGFQEVVPLNVGNVILPGSEEGSTSPAARWDALIRRTLNKSSCCCGSFNGRRSNVRERGWYSGDGGSGSSGARKSVTAPSSPLCAGVLRQVQAMVADDDCQVQGRHSSADENTDMHLARLMSCDYSPCNSFISSSTTSGLISTQGDPSAHYCANCGLPQCRDAQSSYARVASKQMVGIFVSVWMRRDLRRHVKAVEVSSVGCGIMGCFGNKGSVSVSLSLHETSFCFVCSHLKSGDREGDAGRRNADVGEILRRTRFPRPKRLAALSLPETILAHDRIIWFGDLNYRISLPSAELKLLVAKRNWQALLQNDQLKTEQSAGRVFEGWREGPINFAPTYKYLTNSELYALGQVKEGAKRRAPAWCDRVLWNGKGLKQVYYVRAESLCQSDHRPVAALFTAEVEMHSRASFRKRRSADHPFVGVPPFSITKVPVPTIDHHLKCPPNPLDYCGSAHVEVYNVRTAAAHDHCHPATRRVNITRLSPLFPLICEDVGTWPS